jgi:hypothetical protein
MLNYSQSIKPTKCTPLVTYNYYTFRSDMFRRSKHHLQGARDAKFKTNSGGHLVGLIN